MGNWFSSAANVFRREESNGPQPFQLPCTCGMQHSGLRRQRHQHLVCKSCGTSVFVLPGDVYPPPRETKRKPQVDEATPELSPIEPAASAAETAKSGRETVKSEGKKLRQQPTMSMPTIAELPPDMESEEQEIISIGPRKKEKKKKTEKEPSKTPVPARTPPGESLWTILAQVFSPFRLIVAGVLLLLAVTALWGIQKRAERNALTIVETEIEQGREALDGKQWIEARDHFGLAVDAFDVLGRTDAQAQEVRQLHRETRVLTRLTGGSIFEVIEAGDDFLKTGKVEDVNEFLKRKFGVDWFVVDGPVRRRETDPERDKKVQHPYELVLPWRPESDRRVQVQVDFACFESLISSGEPRPLLLAGKLQSCQLVDDTWVLRMEPESGFVWVNPVTHRALGIPADPQESDAALRARFAQQANAMGVTP